MIILLVISIAALILPLILRGKILVRYICIGALCFVLAMFFVGVQTSSRVAISEKYQKEHVIPSEEWSDGAVQARLEATAFLPAAIICILGLAILALLPTEKKEKSPEMDDT